MKAIDNFLVEATKQYGENATISIDQAKQVLKEIKRAIGIGHIRQSGMLVGNKVKLKTVNVAKSDVSVVTKKEVVKEVVKETSQDNATVNLVMGSDIQNLVPSPFEGFVS